MALCNLLPHTVEIKVKWNKQVSCNTAMSTLRCLIIVGLLTVRLASNSWFNETVHSRSNEGVK